jgi:hypothetical protein
MKIGDKVYVAWVGPEMEGVYEYTLEEFGVDRSILRDKDEGYGEFKRPGRLLSARRDHVFDTRKAAEEYLDDIQPQIGDYVAVLVYSELTKGLVVKTTPKMVEILLSNEDDIARNNGKMKSRHHKHNVVTLIRNSRQ